MYNLEDCVACGMHTKKCVDGHEFASYTHPPTADYNKALTSLIKRSHLIEESNKIPTKTSAFTLRSQR